MKQIIFSCLILATSQVKATEYQKMFSCAQSLKSDAQIANTAVAKNFVVLPAKQGTTEGINIFFQTGVYFCKLPTAFKVKRIDEKFYTMNLAIPKQKAIYVSYLKSPIEAPELTIMNSDESIEVSQTDLKKIKLTPCNQLVSDAHSEKVFADFLRKQIAEVHEKVVHETESKLTAQTSVQSLKLCEKSFLLKSITENELKKFESRVPASDPSDDSGDVSSAPAHN